MFLKFNIKDIRRNFGEDGNGTYTGQVTKYRGEYVPHGRGWVKFDNGYSFDGVFKYGSIYYGRYHIAGLRKTFNQLGIGTYSGEAKKENGEFIPYGKGQIKFDNGSTYNGNVYNGTLGFGELNLKNVRFNFDEAGYGTYTGVALNNFLGQIVLDGKGSVMFDNGDSFVGNFVGCYPYYGVYKWANGTSILIENVGKSYDIDDKPHYNFKFNRLKYKTIDLDKMLPKAKNATMVKVQNNTYTGEMKNGKYDGIGEYVWDSGIRYTGGFKENKQHGVGRFRYPNGKDVIQIYNNGKPLYTIELHPGSTTYRQNATTKSNSTNTFTKPKQNVCGVHYVTQTSSSTYYDDIFQKGLSAFNNGEYSKAKSHFCAVKNSGHANEYRTTDGDSVDDLCRQCTENENKEKYNTIYQNGLDAYNKGDYSTARKYFDEVKRSGYADDYETSDGDSVDDMRHNCDDKERYDAVYQKGLDAYNDGRYTEAKNHFRELQYSGHSDDYETSDGDSVDDMSRACDDRERYDEIYDKGLEAYNNGDYAEADRYFSEIQYSGYADQYETTDGDSISDLRDDCREMEDEDEDEDENE